MGRLFGTDGVRGIANRELTAQLAFSLGRAGAQALEAKRILIGKDTRISGDMLEHALVAGILSAGADCVLAGVIPTPGVAYLCRTLGMDAGVVISASHNPRDYNGIKFFGGDGYKLSDAQEDRLEALMQEQGYTGSDVGRVLSVGGTDSLYLEFLRGQCPQSLEGLTIVVDGANGAASALAPVLFQSLGATVIPLHCTPDGKNINNHCGSTYPQDLQAAVREHGASLGLAFDGDADRLIACDDRGELVDGDVILGLLAMAYQAAGKLKDDTLVVTQMSNLGLELSLKAQGIKLIKTGVGDRYVSEAMLAGGYLLGGEQSGHVLMMDRSTTGDGMQSALALCALLVGSGQRMSELRAAITILPQVLVGAHVAPQHKQHYADHPRIKAAIEELEAQYKDNGRVLIRPSGTEHLVRVMIEGEDEALMRARAQALCDLMEELLG